MDAATTAYINATFQKIRLLRSNNKGEVWLASDSSGKLVIIKRINITGLPYKTLKDHPHQIAPKIIYCAEQDKETLIVEEYIQGDSLLERLEQKCYLTEKEAEYILLGLCDGLKPLHDLGIIHRDIKPSNLILQNGCIIRLIDFDAARTVKSDSSEDTRLLGTKGYAPPEQFGYGQTDGRSDIYSIGITMKKMLGREYHGYLEKILNKCTEIDPKKRYASVLALKQAILWNRRKLVKIATLLAIAMIFLTLLYAKSAWMPLPQSSHEEMPGTNEATVPPRAATVTESPPPPLEETTLPETITHSSETPLLPPNSKETATPVEVPTLDKNLPLPQLEPEYIVPRPMETSFTLNGAVVNTTQDNLISMDRNDWSDYSARLHVENSSNTTWDSPSIRVVFRDNWGGRHTETISLAPIPSGESADFDIPVGSYPVTNRPDATEVSAWLQIYLDHGDLPVSERYWCLQFLLKENESKVQDGSKS